MKNILKITNRNEFRKWLTENAKKEKECYLVLKRGKPDYSKKSVFYYLDAVEEALCFGWIDSTLTKFDGKLYQRFSPRKNKNCLWTELNKERARRLIKIGLMTECGFNVLPNLDTPFIINTEIKTMLKNASVFEQFCSFPPLYQRIRAYNLSFCLHKLDKTTFEKSFNHFLSLTQQGKMYGEWNDYGRLLDY